MSAFSSQRQLGHVISTREHKTTREISHTVEVISVISTLIFPEGIDSPTPIWNFSNFTKNDG